MNGTTKKWSAWVAIILTILITGGGIAFAYGKLNARVDEHDRALPRIENKLDKMQEDLLKIKIKLKVE